ncbi:Remorin, C-terminal [Sesbania bispinosa]|nr:Remorin, C-terminal [Sesbania bispinosa]
MSSPELRMMHTHLQILSFFCHGSKKFPFNKVRGQRCAGRQSSYCIRESKQNPLHGKDLKKISTETQTSGLQREEAKIIAWESLQKAKAEAAIRKLEMKLEKKRSSSMDKILNKLRRAQMKAEKMRSIYLYNRASRFQRLGKCFHSPNMAIYCLQAAVSAVMLRD